VLLLVLLAAVVHRLAPATPEHTCSGRHTSTARAAHLLNWDRHSCRRFLHRTGRSSGDANCCKAQYRYVAGMERAHRPAHTLSNCAYSGGPGILFDSCSSGNVQAALQTIVGALGSAEYVLKQSCCEVALIGNHSNADNKLQSHVRAHAAR
jgi:hypothetical protein